MSLDNRRGNLAGRRPEVSLPPFGRWRRETDQRYSSTDRSGAVSVVIALSSVALDPCRALRGLIARAPWLADDPARHLTPLVETRRRAIVRRGAVVFTVDWDGTLRVR